MSKRNLLLLSTTTVYGSGFMEYCMEEILQHFSGLDEIVFVPYARPGGMSHDVYTNLVREKLEPRGVKVTGIHELKNPINYLQKTSGLYIGGGNTFVLLNELYRNDILNVIRDRVHAGELRYMGSSAGTNVACQAINNTNDMPIVYPPSFDALQLIPFNINPHYLDPDPTSKHRGETRETRIREFHFQSSLPVVGLREGSWLKVDGDKIKLGGELTARIFLSDKESYESGIRADLSFLLDSGKN